MFKKTLNLTEYYDADFDTNETLNFTKMVPYELMT